MSQVWLPPDIASICPEQHAPLTQCSQIGFMYLALLTRLYGGSKDSAYKPYSSAVQFSSASGEIETSITGPSRLGPTQSPFGQTRLPYGQTELLASGIPEIPQLNQAHFGSSGPFSQIGSSAYPFVEPQAFGYRADETPLGPIPIKSPSAETATVGLGPVKLTDFSINHSTKIHSHGPRGSQGFSEASFYLKPELGKADEPVPQKEYGASNDFEFGSSFGKYDSPLFDFNYVKRSFQDIDAAASESEVKKTVTEGGEARKKNRRRRQVEEFDFIVVGAGSAGCVVANRLSEVKKWKILLLEAGPEEPEVTSVPALAPVLASSSVDWSYRTQPEELTCRSQRGQSCAWISGKVMGGSSSVNYVVYMRGNKRDYDDWAEMGNDGWSFKEVLPYFIKSENNRDEETRNTKYHGVSGPMNVERLAYVGDNVAMLVEAFNQSGLPLVDFNGKSQLGTMTTQTTSKNARRISSNAAFIRPIRYKRKNLVIVTKALITKILIEPENKIAYGVKYLRNGKWYTAHAKKEVILSAGALGSPKILMLSGVGPKHELESLKIPVIKNLSVGKNLQDHATTNAMLIKLSNKTSTLIQGNEMLNELNKYFHLKHKTGPLSAPGLLHVSAFIRTKYADEDQTVPDIQFHFDGRHLKDFYSDPTTYIATNVLPFSFYDSINVRPILLLPRSRGFITLNRTDPIFGHPLIYPRFFTEKIDLDTLIEGCKFAVSLENTKVFRENGAQFVREPVEGCKEFKWGTDEYFSCLFTSYTGTIFHPSGTCKMGSSNDKDAVVNARLKVYGIQHLRVADTSIMPNIVRGNTNAPAIMIGEKVSDMIKEDWKHFI